MLLPLAGRRLYYDLAGPENGPVVCITHSLASDGGSWASRFRLCCKRGSACCASTCAGMAAAIPLPATIR